MMRVAIAGSNNLAAHIAHYIAAETNHQFVIISRNVCCFFFSYRADLRRRQSGPSRVCVNVSNANVTAILSKRPNPI